MPIKAYNPTTPARRGMTSQDMSEVTTRHRGGGVKRHYRLLNHRMATDMTLTVEEIEYDPNRSARIARVKDQHGLYHYILADTAMKKGKTIKTGDDAPVESSNRMKLAKIPVGTLIYAVEINPGHGSQMMRSAGSKAQLMAKEGDYATLKMPSGEIRRFRLDCEASIGVVGNVQHQNVKIGSAGRNRRKGIRPGVRGVVMNATDHPHGGGDGGRHGSGKPPRTPWGQLTLGYRTRTRKSTNKMIVRSRHEAKRKR